jgi:hypothetical protein
MKKLCEECEGRYTSAINRDNDMMGQHLRWRSSVTNTTETVFDITDRLDPEGSTEYVVELCASY